MANILDRYGIKEVADGTFYDIKDDGTAGAPVLYLDTLKVSTVEQTAENVSARGGKGNAELITWDYGKEITVNIEDALYSAKSLAIQYGDGKVHALDGETYPDKILKTVLLEQLNEDGTATVDGKKFTFVDGSVKYYKADGTPEDAKSTETFYITGEVAVEGFQIDVSANSFPGTYYFTGDTYARSETTGKDEFFQFIMPKVKVLAESNTFTLEAEGDPTVFSMNLKVLRPKDGVMMKLVQYKLTETSTPATGE